MTKANENKPLVVGLAGFGTVGGGLARLLKENADIIRRRRAKGRKRLLPKGAEIQYKRHTIQHGR